MLSTTDENELEMIKEPETEKIKFDTKLDAVFDLVLDLRQQDLDQYKHCKSKKEDARAEPEPEPEPEPVKGEGEPKYRFKHPCGVSEVTVSNLGRQSELDRVVLPTKTLKIEQSSEPVRQTRDIAPLIVKTTASRLERLDRVDTDNVTLHIEEDLNTKSANEKIPPSSPERSSLQAVTKEKSKNSPGSLSPLTTPGEVRLHVLELINRLGVTSSPRP